MTITSILFLCAAYCINCHQLQLSIVASVDKATTRNALVLEITSKGTVRNNSIIDQDDATLKESLIAYSKKSSSRTLTVIVSPSNEKDTSVRTLVKTCKRILALAPPLVCIKFIYITESLGDK